MKRDFLKETKGGLIVSCQALEEEPLHSSYIMSRMAYAAMQGGARGIRANSVEDIAEIRKVVDLPMIGIIKQVYGDSDVYITPTMAQVDALAAAGVEVIAMDATHRPRPGGRCLEDVFGEIRAKYPGQLFMADCATYEDGVRAKALGFDLVGTTLCGYTEDTKGTPLPSLDLIRRFCDTLEMPVIAEGGIWDAPTLARVLATPGIHAAVVGSAITRPREITRHFVEAIGR